MSIFGLPLILFQIPSGLVADDELSDIQYLAIKEFDDKRVDVDGGPTTIANTATETTLVTQTASSGKDMYIASASVPSAFIGNTTVTFNITFRLYQNTTVVDQVKVQINTLDDDESLIPIDFKSIGFKVAAGEIIKITAQHSLATASSTSTSTSKLVLWEEDTGVTPQIPPLNPA